MKALLQGSRLNLILLGIGLGWIATIILGAPPTETGPPRTIDRPLEVHSEEVIDLPILNPAVLRDESETESGLVPPIRIPGILFDSQGGARFYEDVQDEYSHDADAVFEAHGHQICASGCAASRHPTARLTPSKFTRLVRSYAAGTTANANKSLEELLYFGPQTRKLLATRSTDVLDSEKAEFLWDQLSCTHARISIRITDEQGDVRTWIEPTRVPFDRRHVFEMQTKDVQPLVTSGTVKRVGLNHVWARL